MIKETVLSYLLIFCSRTAIVGVWIDGYATTWCEYSGHLNIFRIHQFNQVFHDFVHAVFMKVTVITVTEQVEFQTFAFHHANIGNVLDSDFCKVGLTCNWT